MITNKRGALEIQLNWIFVLIAGAIILIAVFGFLSHQKKATQLKVADTLLKDIEALATGTSALKEGAQQITLPKTEIEIICTEDCSCTINTGQTSKDFRDKQIFAPQTLSGLNAVFWAKSWDVPFRATNFLYITDKSAKYYFVYINEAESQSLKQKIEQLLPAGINTEFISPQEIGELKADFDQSKFIFLNTPIQEPGKNFGKNTRIITLTDALITFWENKEAKSVGYITDAELFGAIFADNFQLYSCNMEKAKKRLKFIANIYKERAKKLNDLFAASQEIVCGYDTAISELEAFENDMDIAKHTFIIKGLNAEKIVQSCPLIY